MQIPAKLTPVNGFHRNEKETGVILILSIQIYNILLFENSVSYMMPLRKGRAAPAVGVGQVSHDSDPHHSENTTRETQWQRTGEGQYRRYESAR